MSLQGISSTRRENLTGIVNGIDMDVRNHATDPNIPTDYDNRNHRPPRRQSCQTGKALRGGERKWAARVVRVFEHQSRSNLMSANLTLEVRPPWVCISTG